MGEWVLIIYIFAGELARGNNVALLQVPGFTTIQACQTAGNQVKPFISRSSKEIRFICVNTKGEK